MIDGTWQGKMLGRYQLLQLVGRGGMGEVWLAYDTQLRRRVAIKLLPAVLASDANYLKDFTNEARTLAVLEHPHILPVHDFGEQITGDEITTYLVMPYITGGSLRDRIHSNAGPLAINDTLKTLRQAAEAIDYAHRQHVLHRDIKPGNMLLQENWVLLADFGLAKLLSNATHRSHTHTGAGTPEYMAPEQAQGSANVASDRYSFAIVAYQLFTGHLPFRSETAYQTLIQQIRKTPPSPRQFVPTIPQSVENTLLHGLAKRPEERPASCIAFIDALEQGWNLEQPTSIDPEATLLAHWSKRQNTPISQKRPVLSAPHLTPLLNENSESPTSIATMQRSTPQAVTSTYTSTMPSAPLPQTVPVEQQNQQEIPQEKRIGRRAVIIGGAMVATTAIVASRFVLPTLLHHPIATVEKAFPGPHHLIPGTPVLSLIGHTDDVWNVVWDPTGRYLATAGQDTRVMLWDVGNALQKNSGFQPISTPLNSWKFAGEIVDNHLCWSPDGHALIATVLEPDASNKIHFINAFSRNTPSIYTDVNVNSLNTPQYSNIAWRPNTASFTASVSTIPFSVRVDMWQVGHMQHVSKSFTYQAAPQIQADELAWSSDGSMLAANLNDFKVVVWKAQTGKVLQAIKLPNRSNQSVVQILRGAIEWSPVEPNVLLVSDVDVCIVLNVKQNKILHILGTDDPDALTPPKPNPDNWVPNTLGLSWSPNGRYIVGGYGRSAKMYLWDLQNKTPKLKNSIHIQDTFIPASASTGGHNGIVIDNAWSPDGRYLASASADKTVIVWKMDAS